MQKYLAVLEKQVEWIAVGLAGLWMLWLVWAFGISKPATIEINGQQYTPGNVDAMVWREVAEPLQPKISSQAVPKLPKATVALKFLEEMAPQISGEIAPLAVWSPPARDMQPIRTQTGPKLLPDVKIAALPKVPAIKITEFQSERDQVIVPPPPKPESEGGTTLAQGMFGFPGAVAPAADPSRRSEDEKEITPVDKYWVTVFGKFSERELDAAFKEVKIPPYLSNKVYLSLQLVRQERMPDGSWGNERLVPPLAMNAPPTPREKDPTAYMAWAMQPESQLMIVQPPFYETMSNKWLGGPPPDAPSVDEQELLAQQVDLSGLAQQLETMSAAEATTTINKMNLTVEQKQQLHKLREALKAQRRQERASQYQNRSGGMSPNRSYPRPGMNRAAQDPDVLREMYAQATPGNPYLQQQQMMLRMQRMQPGMYPGMYRQPGMYPGRPGMMQPGMYPGAYPGMPSGMMPPGMMPPGMMPPGMMPPGMMPPGVPQLPMEPGLPNVVRPNEGLQEGQLVDFDVWAHDETVVPGKTYRYKMRLTIRNPVYKMEEAVTDPALAKPLELPTNPNESWSEWSEPIEVQPQVQMFLAGGSTPGKDLVRFDVYRWQNGKVNKTPQAITVGPGDMIGGVDKVSGIDFTTGWSVADIRQVGNSDWRVTLVNDDGAQKVRYLKADTSDATRKQLEQDAQRAIETAKAEAALKAAGAADTTAVPR